MPEQTPEQENLVEKAKKLVLQLKFVWFVGQLTTVTQAILLLVGGGSWNYYKAYYGSIISYGIILYNAHGRPQLSKEFLARILQDENTQYFLLSLVWVTSAIIRVTLIPYAVYSLFHSLGYIRTELVPKLFPAASGVSTAISSFMSQYQSKLVHKVAQIEVWVIFPMTLVTIFWGGTSIFTPFLYQQFLQFRYLSSPLTKKVFHELEVTLDQQVSNPNVPIQVKSGYEFAKAFIKKHCDLEAKARAQKPHQQ